MGWWCAMRLRGARIAWRGWRRPKRCWKLVPRNVQQPSKQSMRPRWRSARSGSARRDVAQVVAHRAHRPQGLAPLPDPPPQDASAQVKMAYKLRTALGKAIYGVRKCTVEPVIGIIKEVLGFRQFSLRGISAAAGEWCLVCLAFNLKRFHTLSWA